MPQISDAFRGLALMALVISIPATAQAQQPRIVQVAAGGSHTCALDDTQRVWC